MITNREDRAFRCASSNEARPSDIDAADHSIPEDLFLDAA